MGYRVRPVALAHLKMASAPAVDFIWRSLAPLVKDRNSPVYSCKGFNNIAGSRRSPHSKPHCETSRIEGLQCRAFFDNYYDMEHLTDGEAASAGFQRDADLHEIGERLGEGDAEAAADDLPVFRCRVQGTVGRMPGGLLVLAKENVAAE